MRERIVDARWLEPPEPMELTLSALNVLEPDEQLRLLIHRIPHLLFPILQEWGYGFKMEENEVGTYEILIWYKGKPSGTDDAGPA